MFLEKGTVGTLFTPTTQHLKYLFGTNLVTRKGLSKIYISEETWSGKTTPNSYLNGLPKLGFSPRVVNYPENAFRLTRSAKVIILKLPCGVLEPESWAQNCWVLHLNSIYLPMCSLCLTSNIKSLVKVSCKTVWLFNPFKLFLVKS